jgi:hypothetical protein
MLSPDRDRSGETSSKIRLFLAWSLLQVVSLVMFQEALPAFAQRVGGPCEYDGFPGNITIIEVRPVPQPEVAHPPLPYQPNLVLFTFAPSVPVPNSLYEPGKIHELTLSGGTPPGPEFLKKYGIRPGVEFKSELRLIRTGTCTPVVFTFQGVDVVDFFELEKR